MTESKSISQTLFADIINDDQIKLYLYEQLENMYIYKFNSEIFLKSKDHSINKLVNHHIHGYNYWIGHVNYLILSHCNNNFTGMGVCSYHKTGTIKRACQWQFGENMKRNLWIDALSSNYKGHGTLILNKMEELLKCHVEESERKNIYTVSCFHSCGFFHSRGYDEILTLEHDDDEDHPYVFSSELNNFNSSL